VRCEGKGKGKPVTFVLTPGQQHECTVFEQLMEQGKVPSNGLAEADQEGCQAEL
jgi:hypothetical protein